jgi:hypothetical protein
MSHQHACSRRMSCNNPLVTIGLMNRSVYILDMWIIHHALINPNQIKRKHRARIYVQKWMDRRLSGGWRRRRGRGPRGGCGAAASPWRSSASFTTVRPGWTRILPPCMVERSIVVDRRRISTVPFGVDCSDDLSHVFISLLSHACVVCPLRMQLHS